MDKKGIKLVAQSIIWGIIILIIIIFLVLVLKDKLGMIFK